MRLLQAGLRALLAGSLILSSTALAADDENRPQILFTNVNVFNGTDNKLYEDHQVLIEGNLIKTISAGEIDARSDAQVIDGGGRTLMPGLIDAHTHMNLNIAGGVGALEAATWEEIGSRSAYMAQEYLAMGFTSVREMGGSGAGLKKTVDEGLVPF